MALKQFCFLVIFFSSLTDFAVLSQKYEHISDCFYTKHGDHYGSGDIMFICAEVNQENMVFLETNDLRCSNYSDPINSYDGVITVEHELVGSIDFKNCQFRQIERNFCETFKWLRVLDLSNLKVESLQKNMFVDAKNLQHLIAPQNHLTEIPALLFIYAKKIIEVNFSNNSISHVNSLAFVGAENLEILDLSLNKIDHLDATTLNLPKLLTLDLSHNDLTITEDHTFDNMTNLRHLNLSFNPIGNLKIETFAHLTNLMELNLKRTNITAIELGTFSHQHRLTLLDLSENNLKELDFSHFMPILPDLHLLYLNGNQLTHLNGFTNDLLPNLLSLDIKNNKFNCTYLLNFMKTVNWQKLRLPLDTNAINPLQSSIRGINCEIVTEIAIKEEEEIKATAETNVTTEIKSETETKCAFYDLDKSLKMIFNATSSKINQPLITDLFKIRMMLLFICFISIAFFILFVVLNKDRIKLYGNSGAQSSLDERTVAYSNHPEVLLIEKH